MTVRPIHHVARAPSERPRSAVVVGLGSAGLRHLNNLRSLGVDRLIAVSTGRSTHPKLSDSLAGVTVEHTVCEALEHRPALAVIATPTSLHLEQAMACAHAGCHLLVEKPLSHTVEGLDTLQAAVDQAGSTAMVAFQFRFHPLIQKMREWILAGRLGLPLHAGAQWGEHLPDFHPWEDYRNSYAARESLGGGVIRTLIHPLDYLVFLLGNAGAAHVTVARSPVLETDTPDDAAVVTMTHLGGAISTTRLDFNQRPAVHDLSVVGSDARASIDFHAGRLLFVPPAGETERVDLPAGFARNQLFRDELAYLLGRIETGERLTASPLAQSADLLRVVLPARAEAIGHIQNRVEDASVAA